MLLPGAVTGGWLPWWQPGTVEPFGGPPARPDIGIDLDSWRRAGVPRPVLPGPCVAADLRIDALEVAARWPCEARARAAEDQLPAPALIAALVPSGGRAASPAACATRAFADTGQL